MSLQERLETIRSSPAPQNEESAKFQILAPILQNLGWDPSEVLLEYSAGGKRSGGRIDMALKGPGRIVALIEAKSPGTNLNDHVDQVIGYAHHEGVDICVLTSGLEWWMYLPRERGRPPKRRFAVLRVVDDPIEELTADLTRFLSRDALVSGNAEKHAKTRLEEVRLNTEVPSIWTRMLEEPDAELVALVRRRVHETTHLQLSKDQVAAALQGLPIPSGTAPTAPPETTPSPTRPKQAAEARTPRGRPLRPPTRPKQAAKPQDPQPRAKPVAMELWGERYEVKSHIDAFRKFLDLLCERHRGDLDRVLELKGHKNAYAARDPREVKYGNDGYYYEPLSSGFFFDTWLSAKDIKRRASQYLTLFGHDPSDFEVLYD